nr:MAG TPA: hypothetical protein [Caudoviricetes sp.]
MMSVWYNNFFVLFKFSSESVYIYFHFFFPRVIILIE